MTFLISYYCLSASVFQAQHIQVGSVYIGNTSGKLELLSEVGLMMAQVTIFFLLRSVLEQCTAFCYAAFVRYEVVPVNTSDGQSSSGVCAIDCGMWQMSVAFAFRHFQKVLFCFLIYVCNPEKLHLMSFL